MKNKLLSLLLVITLLAVTISVGLPSTLAADDGNLFTNGDFSDGYNGWGSKGDNNGASIQKNVQITDTLTTNAVKINTKANKMFALYNKNKIKIEKNTSYTMSFWVKMTDVKGFTTYLFEPDYTAKDGTYKTDEWSANDGVNIYTYSYDNGSTRVCRTDIKHTWKVAETGREIGDANGVSMFITRSKNDGEEKVTDKVLTPDFPYETREGEWLQVIHTFETGNTAAHEAVGAYYFKIPKSAVVGEIWFADFKMYATKKTVDETFTPSVNDATLGTVSKDVPLFAGTPAEITAEPFGENKFDGWYVDGVLVSTDATYSFTYDPANPPKYEARFTKAAFGIDGSFETGYSNGQVLAQAVNNQAPNAAGTDWTTTTFLSTEKDNSGVFIDSTNTGTWRKASITNAVAHTGKNSLKYAGQYGSVGYKYSNLTPNTDYKLSVYAYITADDTGSIKSVVVAPADESCLKKLDNGYNYNSVDSLAYKFLGSNTDFQNGWTKLEMDINTKDNTEVILWLESGGTNAVLYLDNFAIARPAKAFQAKVNDVNLGKATSETTDVYEGASVTVTAESINDGQFEGWYIGEELMSTDATYTFSYEAKFDQLYAKFKAGPNTLADYSFENSFTNGQVLAESPKVAYSDNDTAGLWTPDLYKTSSKDGNNTFFIDSEWSQYGKAIATTEQAHTGSYSIKMSPNSRSVGYKLAGLEKDTNYTINFYAYTTGTTDNKVDTVGNIIVTDANQSCVVKGTDNRLVYTTTDTGALALTRGLGTDCRGAWKKYSIRFNSKDSTDVILWVRPEGAGTNLYLDDVTIGYTPKEFKPASNNSGLGTVTPTDFIECTIGQSVTVTATPFTDVAFTGWYVGDELISTDANFTFKYEDKYQGLTAVFAGIPGTIPNGGLEYYQNGQVLASYKNPDFNNNAPWYVDTTYRTDTDVKLTVTNQLAHTGEKSVKNNVPYRYTGLDIEGLEPGTKYLVSFWAYITGQEPTYDTNPKNVTNAFVLAKGKTPVVYDSSKGKWVSIGNNHYLGSIGGQVDAHDKWSKVDVIFTTPADSGDVTLWINYSGQGANLYLDDFVVGTGIKGNVSAELGGSVETSATSEYVLKGTEVTVKATPYEGNTFTGWYNAIDEKVSDLAEYTFTAESDYTLIAKFDGYNKPALDLFSVGGKDGTFETGTIGSWRFSDKTYGCEWCSAAQSDKFVYEGQRSLAVNGRYRSSILPLTGLAPSTNYRLSFYINIPDNDPKAQIDSFGIVGSEFDTVGDANLIFAQMMPIKANSGWNRVDLYFNTASYSTANLVMRFSAETLSGGLDKVYLDNVSLYAYNPTAELTNGSFDDGKTNWIGKGTVVADGDNNVLSLGEGETVYQNVKTVANSRYTVTFKAKGQFAAAAIDLGKFDITNKNLINSTTYTLGDGTEWTEYTYEVYSGVNQAINFAFTAGENGAMIDDVKIVKEADSSNGVLEYIDFESDRFDLTSISANSPYSIYTATDENDPNVVSGNKALKFTYNPALVDTVNVLGESWLSYQPGIGTNYKITFKYKVVEGKMGGAINIAPEYSGTYGADTGLEHLAKNSDWNTITFYVNNTNFGALKLKIANVVGVTVSDFYIDDIMITVAPPMVSEENSKTTYCERLYNAIDNESFESPATDKDWKNLPKTVKIVKGDALKGSHFLRAKAGTDYVVQFDVEPNSEYFFAASVRGTAKTVGSIGVTVDAAGKVYYANRDEVPASVVEFDASEKGWKRKGFKFFTTGDGKVNVRIRVTSGELDIDSVMLFTSDFAYRYDPNDYTVYVPYDYDNLKSETSVLYGGFGKQPYYTGKIDTDENGLIDGDLDGDGISDDIVLDESELEDDTDAEEDTDSPATGDSETLPVMMIILAVIASVALMFITKRKEGAENA